jgi:cysteine desulfurase
MQKSDWIYLDYAASTPVDTGVAELLATLGSGDGLFANPSSGHAPGRAAAAAIENAAGQLASLVNCEPRQIVWTSGATESDNLAIQGAARYREQQGRHLVTMRTEHKAVFDVFRALEKQGFEVTWLPPRDDGVLDIKAFEAALREDTQLVSIMFVNNETGVVQDLDAIGRICRDRDVLFHVDAAQAVGKLPIDLAKMPVDLMSMTAHKMYGPKGVGALYIAERPGCHIEPLFFGGGQQRGRRPGTLPAPLIAAYGLAAEIAVGRMDEDLAHVTAMRDRFWAGIRKLPGLTVNGDLEGGFAGILNVGLEDIEGESLLLDLEPLCVATGSACNSKSTRPSGVLRALGLSDAQAQGAIRFSFGRPTTTDEVDIAIGRYRRAVERLRSIAPGQAA